LKATLNEGLQAVPDSTLLKNDLKLIR